MLCVSAYSSCLSQMSCWVYILGEREGRAIKIGKTEIVMFGKEGNR